MVKGQTYNLQLFESEAFRHFINTFLNKESGITKGCEISRNSNSIDISEGYFIICGGMLKEEGTSNIIPSEAGYYKLVYEIDLSKANSEAEFNQGTYKFVKGVGNYVGLTQEDLDNNGTVYQFEFCQFRVTEAGVQDFSDKRKFLDFDSIYEEIRQEISNIKDESAFSIKPKILWQNDMASTKFAAQTIQLASDDYDYLVIFSYRNANLNLNRTISTTVEKNKHADLNYADYLNITRNWNRKVEASGKSVKFSDAEINGEVSTLNNGVLVPYKIVGFKY